MFGDGGSYEYGRCLSCASLQLLNPPDDMAPYYPAHYYSYDKARFGKRPRRGLRSRSTAAVAERSKSVTARAAAKLIRQPRPWRAVLFFELSRRDRILDVGCGSGGLLADLWSDGFENLTGVDPFLRESTDEHSHRGVNLHTCDLAELAGEFDLVMFNHSLEHVGDPSDALHHAVRVLAPNGRVLIRIPKASSDNAERFVPHWFSLDAPRHVWIPSMSGLVALAERRGLRQQLVSDDSGGFSEAWSLLYERGISQVEEAGVVRDLRSYFTDEELSVFEGRARAANRAGRGDTTRVLFTLA